MLNNSNINTKMSSQQWPLCESCRLTEFTGDPFCAVLSKAFVCIHMPVMNLTCQVFTVPLPTSSAGNSGHAWDFKISTMA